MYPVDTAKENYLTKAKDMVLVQAYPNPVTTELTIENKTWRNNEIAEIRLSDVTGKLLSTKRTVQAKDVISFGDISMGMYTVQYVLNGQLIATWKVLKN
jgi:hypothetical protein